MTFHSYNTGTLSFPVWDRTVLKKLGNNYTHFFRYLGIGPEDIQTGQMDHNQDSATTKLQLWDKYVNTLVLSVAVNNENDTCFGNGLVMGSTDCINYVGLVKTLEKLFKRKPGPLPDTLQAGACVFPPFLIYFTHTSYPPVPAYGTIWIVPPSTFPKKTGQLLGAISGSP